MRSARRTARGDTIGSPLALPAAVRAWRDAERRAGPGGSGGGAVTGSVPVSGRPAGAGGARGAGRVRSCCGGRGRTAGRSVCAAGLRHRAGPAEQTALCWAGWRRLGLGRSRWVPVKPRPASGANEPCHSTSHRANRWVEVYRVTTGADAREGLCAGRALLGRLLLLIYFNLFFFNFSKAFCDNKLAGSGGCWESSGPGSLQVPQCQVWWGRGSRWGWRSHKLPRQLVPQAGCPHRGLASAFTQYRPPLVRLVLFVFHPLVHFSCWKLVKASHWSASLIRALWNGSKREKMAYFGCSLPKSVARM